MFCGNLPFHVVHIFTLISPMPNCLFSCFDSFDGEGDWPFWFFSMLGNFASTGSLETPLDTMMAVQVLYFPVTGLYRVLGTPFGHYDDHTGLSIQMIRAWGSVWHLDLCLKLYFHVCKIFKGIMYTLN